MIDTYEVHEDFKAAGQSTPPLRAFTYAFVSFSPFIPLFLFYFFYIFHDVKIPQGGGV